MYLRPVALAMDWPNEVLPPRRPHQAQDRPLDFYLHGFEPRDTQGCPVFRARTIMVSIEDFLRLTQVFCSCYAHSTAPAPSSRCSRAPRSLPPTSAETSFSASAVHFRFLFRLFRHFRRVDLTLQRFVFVRRRPSPALSESLSFARSDSTR